MHARIQGFRPLDRRSFLLGAAAVVAIPALPACETLTLPDEAAPEDVQPITPNDSFYVTSYDGTPTVDGDTWVLVVLDGLVEVGRITLADLHGLEAREKEHTLSCIGGGPTNPAIGNTIWTGLPLLEVFGALGIVRPERPHLRLSGADGYHTGIPSSDLDVPIWIVWRMGGEPLPPAHGFPARLLVPGRYGTKNPKWVTEIAFLDEHHVGFWEDRLWSDEARYRPAAYILGPPHLSETSDGAIELFGPAFAGSDPVARVQVRVDRGDLQDAELLYAPGADIWTLWRFGFAAPGPGTYRFQVFVVTASGATSSLDPRGTDRLSGYDGGMEIEVEFVA